MKPSPIRVLILEESRRLRQELADFLAADALMDVAGCLDPREPTVAEALRAGADVAVLGLSGDGEADGELLRRLKAAGVRTIAVAHTEAEAARPKEPADYLMTIPAEGARHPEESYTRLRYQIRNARLAQAVEKGGFTGAWRVFPAVGPRPSPEVPAAAAAEPEPRRTDVRLIAIGASAGGTQALMELIPELPPDMPAIALVQHMPEAFVELFAAHLREKSRMRVCLAVGGERVERGVVYLTALDRHLTVVSRGRDLYIACEAGDEGDGLRPSVDRLFFSVAASVGAGAIGLILTGMGADGAKGLLEMRRAGACTIGQDEKSCVVYGMPQAAYRLDAVERQLPLGQISQALQRRVFSSEGSRKDG